jgi:hypothetical protein
VPCHQGLVAAAHERGILRDYETYLFLRHEYAKHEGTGRAGYLGLLAAGLGATRKQANRAARRRLDLFVASPFCEVRPNKDTGNEVVALRSPEAVADELGVALERRARVPVAGLLGRAPLRELYLAVAATRDGGDRPRPTSRSARRAMAGASPQTQRRAEREAGAVPQPQYALGAKPGRPVVHVGNRPAYRIANATDVRSKRGRGKLATGRVQADPKRRYFHDGDGVPGGFRFLGHVTVAGVRAGLWEPVP